jgi:iduronate 2-sulfatase
MIHFKLIAFPATLFNTLFLLFLGLTSCRHQGTAPEKVNILFIAVDDLRPELGCFGGSHIKSPHIDKLAGQGMIFTNAYCNVPVCGASRASLLTGVRPTNKRFVTYFTYADEDLPGHLSLPRYLKNNGYTTISLGKVYHNADDDLEGWSKKPWKAPRNGGIWRDYRKQYVADSVLENQNNKVGPAWEIGECPDTGYVDGKILVRAVEELESLSKQDNPFFLAVGFNKPHLPFNAPKKYWDLYDHESIELAPNPYRPEDAPDISIHKFGELRNGYLGVPDTIPLPDDYARWLRHGYYACVSYTDAQIGKLTAKLEELGLEENTIVILWGDHGWNLGEHTLWCKHCNYETSLNAPIIIKAPGQKTTGKSEALVEFVDIYPTLAELAGLPVPEHCEGRSIVPLLDDPDQSWKDAVFSWWHDGFTMRTEQYQYTEWKDPETELATARMLYDHQVDPEENVNIAELQENEALVDSLSLKMNSWWEHYKENDKYSESDNLHDVPN